jgi:hypothetical protein
MSLDCHAAEASRFTPTNLPVQVTAAEARHLHHIFPSTHHRPSRKQQHDPAVSWPSHLALIAHIPDVIIGHMILPFDGLSPPHLALLAQAPDVLIVGVITRSPKNQEVPARRAVDLPLEGCASPRGGLSGPFLAGWQWCWCWFDEMIT